MKKTKISEIKVFAPATAANLACGFDVFGLALAAPGDFVQMRLNNSHAIRILKISGDHGMLSMNPDENTVSVSVRALLDKLEIKQGFDIILRKKMPLGSGMGSSAASAVAGVFAANQLLGQPFSKTELVRFAMEGERIACGSAHADNVGPSMLGGICLVRSNDPLDIISLPVPPQLFVVLVHPHINVLTRDSRAVLPAAVPLKAATSQWANTAAFVAGLFNNDYSLIGKSVVDHVAEPHRARLIPGFDEVKKAALENGALACSISGSGPSVFALVKGEAGCQKLARAMRKGFSSLNIGSEVYISRVNKKGVSIV